MKKNRKNAALSWLDNNLESAVLIACLFIMTALISVNVVLRYVFSKSLTWSEEICKFCLVTSGFYSLGYCIRFNKMIRVDALIQFLGKKAATVFNCVAWVFMAVFLAVLAYGSVFVLIRAKASGQVNPALDVPMYVLYLIPLSGCAVAVFRIIQLFYFSVRKTLGKRGA
ncbi:TRAP transporter small permease [Treponema parvum]|uniref:TRAP transporter small permease n=1 Tax=Treponema parvum TaxID=138851 RepID=A0A975EY98_9SPIR|nr:TRAP transporter small permease [Treponema parvum]QTQ10870.1 TRAP transporter small permease [Treponema parvum]QTQ17184.1 TRAP transporter small permease [Treponema parvum]